MIPYSSLLESGRVPSGSNLADFESDEEMG